MRALMMAVMLLSATGVYGQVTGHGAVLNVCGVVEAVKPVNEWKYLMQSKETAIYVNEARITCNRQTRAVELWVEMVHADGHVVYLDSYNCLRRKTKALAFARYDGDGGLVNSGTFTDTEWTFVTPETVGEHIFRYACQVR